MIGTLVPPSTIANIRLSSPQIHRPRKTVILCTATAVAETRRTGSLYEVLRINRNASATEIKSAYRSLAKVYHPDLSSMSSSAIDFIKIRKAYETLVDPSARAMYDSSLCSINGKGGWQQGPRQQQQPFRYSTVDGGYGSGGFYYTRTRNWETDQCW